MTHLKLSPRGEKITEPAEPKSFDLGSPRPFEPFPQITPLVSPLREVTLAPWERVELPVFQVEGQRYGGTSAPVNGNIWGNWMGLSGKEQKNRPSIGSSTSPPAQTISRVGSHSTDTTHPSPLFFNTPRLESIPSVMDPDQVLALPGKRKMSADFGSMSPLERIRKGSAIFTLISEPQIVTPSASSVHLSGQQESYDPHVRRASALTQQSRRSFNDPSQAKREFLPVPQPSLSERDSPDVEARQHADEDDQWDLLRVLQQTAPPKTANDRFAPGEGEVVEFVEESMASYLNRKTALLMLWFPLGVSPGCREEHRC